MASIHIRSVSIQGSNQRNTVWVIPRFVYFVGIHFVDSVFVLFFLNVFGLKISLQGEINCCDLNVITYTHIKYVKFRCTDVWFWFGSFVYIYSSFCPFVRSFVRSLFELNDLCTNKIGMAVIYLLLPAWMAHFSLLFKSSLPTNSCAQRWHIVLEPWFGVYFCILMLRLYMCYVLVLDIPWKCNKFTAMETMSILFISMILSQ